MKQEQNKASCQQITSRLIILVRLAVSILSQRKQRYITYLDNENNALCFIGLQILINHTYVINHTWDLKLEKKINHAYLIRNKRWTNGSKNNKPYVSAIRE